MAGLAKKCHAFLLIAVYERVVGKVFFYNRKTSLAIVLVILTEL